MHEQKIFRYNYYTLKLVLFLFVFSYKIILEQLGQECNVSCMNISLKTLKITN